MNETKQCPYCAETIRAEAIKCKHCGEFLSESLLSEGILVIETGLIAIACGSMWSSWWIFIGVLLLLSCLLAFKTTGLVLCLLLSAGWGCAGYWLGDIFFENTTTSIVLTILSAWAGLYVHFTGWQSIKKELKSE